MNFVKNLLAGSQLRPQMEPEYSDVEKSLGKKRILQDYFPVSPQGNNQIKLTYCDATKKGLLTHRQ